MTRPGIRNSLEAVQALCVSVIFAEHSFRDNPRNTQCSNATAIDCNVTSLRCACVCLLCLDLAITVKFTSANFTCTRTIIFKFNEV